MAGLLVLGALGAVAAAWSGEEGDEEVGNAGVAAATVLEEHEMWGERTRNSALLAAVFPMASVLLFRCTRLSRGLGVATAMGAEVSAVAGAEAGHYGGKQVYQHGVGIQQAAEGAAAPSLDRKAKE